ncbi:TIR domain-containing protein [Pseudoxanthomonas suwonensis]|uniref:TIR domain-containing protein n=1 Tax=Pseudoxanthomonas suwonensis TaxID=314722 RepID=UPI000697500B|nr:TIR domain-containing protein [Pseudoxanthomonas suwonensis]
MADIFVSYSRQDRTRVAPLVAALEAQGWSVWWDPEITPGEEFDSLIARELDAARSLIVVWTPQSVDSRWVRGEARDAADRGVLVPVRFDHAKLPIDFRALHATDLDGWNGDRRHAAFLSLCKALEAKLGAGTHAAAEGGKSDRIGICVMPFLNMSNVADTEYFSDGIADEILNLLAKLPKLKVASRTSSFNYKGRQVSIPTVARELGVGVVLEGTVRRVGDRVRITAQLIEAESDSYLWSETYDRDMKDVFAIQDDIAQSIVKALQVTLTPGERRALQVVATTDPVAYDFYLRGRRYMYSMAKRDYEHAIRMFEQAIQIDNLYALAYAGMADAYSQIYRYADASAENVAQAKRASEQALVLDPQSAEAHASRGLALLIDGDYAAAQQEFELAATLNPNLFEAYLYYGLALSSQGEHERAAERYQRAMAINPADFQTPMFLAQAYASLGRRQDEMRVRLAALSTLGQHIRLNPHDTRALYMSALNLLHVGERKQAAELAEQALRQDQDEPLVLYNVACFNVIRGDHERAMDLLERAVEMGFGDRAWIETDSDLDPLHSHPRFAALLARIDAMAAATRGTEAHG